MSLITLGLALDYKTEGGLAATDPITVSSRPFFWQQMERTRANFVIIEDLAAIKHVSVTLTATELRDLPTTPITLIAAPASGKTIVPVSASMYSNVSTAYANVNTTYCAVFIYWLGDQSIWAYTAPVNDSTSSPALVKVTELLTGAGTKHRANLIPYHDSPATTPNGWVIPQVMLSTTYETKALAIAADNNGSSNFTNGSGSSLIVDIAYMVL